MAKLLSMVLLLAVAASMSSMADAAPCKSFYDQLVAAKKFKSLLKIIKRAGYVNRFRNKNLKGTFFAPTDAAIATAVKKYNTDFAVLSGLYLQILVDYHFSPEVVVRKSFRNRTIKTSSTLFTSFKMLVNPGGKKGVFLKTPVNTPPITTANAAFTCKGVIHILNKEPLVPTSL